jgi:hypothetical protein
VGFFQREMFLAEVDVSRRGRCFSRRSAEVFAEGRRGEVSRRWRRGAQMGMFRAETQRAQRGGFSRRGAEVFFHAEGRN